MSHFSLHIGLFLNIKIIIFNPRFIIMDLMFFQTLQEKDVFESQASSEGERCLSFFLCCVKSQYDLLTAKLTQNVQYASSSDVMWLSSGRVWCCPSPKGYWRRKRGSARRRGPGTWLRAALLCPCPGACRSCRYVLWCSGVSAFIYMYILE